MLSRAQRPTATRLCHRHPREDGTSRSVGCSHTALAAVHRKPGSTPHPRLSTPGPERRKNSKKPLKGCVCLLTTGVLIRVRPALRTLQFR
jgi:hypothetical protein